jgi:hypothetical protein
VLRIRIRYPLPFLPLDPGWVKKSGSGMNNPDHISESLKTIFWVKILKFFDADPGSGMKKIRIRNTGRMRELRGFNSSNLMEVRLRVLRGSNS